MAKLKEAKILLEEQVRRAEAEEETARREAEGKGSPAKPPGEAIPEPKDQINFTDPESRIVKASNKAWDQNVNAQAVANENQIILATDVTAQANVKRQAVPMMDQTLGELGSCRSGATDRCRSDGLGFLQRSKHSGLGSDPHIATARLRHNEEIPPVPRGPIPMDLTAKQRMARKLRTKISRKVYAKRKGIIERIFGQLKQVLGFRQFSLRGLEAMRGKWRLMCTVHNLLKLWRHSRAAAGV